MFRLSLYFLWVPITSAPTVRSQLQEHCSMFRLSLDFIWITITSATMVRLQSQERCSMFRLSLHFFCIPITSTTTARSQSQERCSMFRLSLNFINIGDAGAIIAGALPHVPSLTSLDLGLIPSAPMARSQSQERCSMFRLSLIFIWVLIPFDGDRNRRSTAHIPSLTSLKLWRDGSAIAIAGALQHVPSLTVLYLSWCDCTMQHVRLRRKIALYTKPLYKKIQHDVNSGKSLHLIT